MAHEVDRLFNEIKWAIGDKIGQIQTAIGQAQDKAAEQWASLMVKSYAATNKMTESQARTALIILGVAAACKADNKVPAVAPTGQARQAFDIAFRAIRIVL
jgi:hypothetical protein